MTMVETLAPLSIFSAEHSHYYGANVQGKPKKFLLNPGGGRNCTRSSAR